MNKTVKYYSQFGSRIGYKLVAGGHRHFGYYGDKKYIYIPHAATAMIDYLAHYAKIKPGDTVLDAGCGEGRASLRIKQKIGANVYGVDLVPASIKIAKKRAKKANLVIDYRIADYNKLPYENNFFDIIFTLETFTHSPDPVATIKEFLRVLKPGGSIVIFDYSIKDLSQLNATTKAALQDIARLTNCPSFVKIFHDYYQKVLPKMGIKNYKINNLTRSVMPSLSQLYVISWPIFWWLRLIGKANKHPNVLIAHYGKIWAKNDTWRYVTVKITKNKTLLKASS